MIELQSYVADMRRFNSNSKTLVFDLDGTLRNARGKQGFGRVPQTIIDVLTILMYRWDINICIISGQDNDVIRERFVAYFPKRFWNKIHVYGCGGGNGMRYHQDGSVDIVYGMTLNDVLKRIPFNGQDISLDDVSLLLERIGVENIQCDQEALYQVLKTINCQGTAFCAEQLYAIMHILAEGITGIDIGAHVRISSYMIAAGMRGVRKSNPAKEVLATIEERMAVKFVLENFLTAMGCTQLPVITRTGRSSLDISGVGKGQAIINLMENLTLSPADVLVFADGYSVEGNDAQMVYAMPHIFHFNVGKYSSHEQYPDELISTESAGPDSVWKRLHQLLKLFTAEPEEIESISMEEELVIIDADVFGYEEKINSNTLHIANAMRHMWYTMARYNKQPCLVFFSLTMPQNSIQQRLDALFPPELPYHMIDSLDIMSNSHLGEHNPIAGALLFETLKQNNSTMLNTVCQQAADCNAESMEIMRDIFDALIGVSKNYAQNEESISIKFNTYNRGLLSVASDVFSFAWNRPNTMQPGDCEVSGINMLLLNALLQPGANIAEFIVDGAAQGTTIQNKNVRSTIDKQRGLYKDSMGNPVIYVHDIALAHDKNTLEIEELQGVHLHVSPVQVCENFMLENNFCNLLYNWYKPSHPSTPSPRILLNEYL